MEIESYITPLVLVTSTDTSELDQDRVMLVWNKDKEKLYNARSEVSIDGTAVDEISDSSSAGNTLYENFGKA